LAAAALRGGRALALAVVILGLLAGPPALRAQEVADGAFEPQKAQEAFEKTARRLGLQTGKAQPVPPASPSEPFEFPDILKEILLGLSAVFLVLAFLSLRRHKWKRKNRGQGEKGREEPGEPRPDTAALQGAGQRADRLAAQGRITEAMHALLLGTIGELKRQKGLTVPESHTSREIVQFLGLGPLAGQCLGDIVATVEPTWFGGLAPDLGQYQALRRKFDDFLGILSG
jgi:hypothetical protein